MYSCILNPSYTDEEFARVFNDSWAKLPSHLTQFTQEESLTKQQSRVAKMNCNIGVYEDSYLLALLSGIENDKKVILVSAYFGKDSTGSKAYVHNADWYNTVIDFSKEHFDEFGFTTIDSSPMDIHAKTQIGVRDTRFGDAVTQTDDHEGVTYNGSNYKTS